MKTHIRKLSFSAEIGMISDVCSFKTVVEVVEIVASRTPWFIYDIKLQKKKKAEDILRFQTHLKHQEGHKKKQNNYNYYFVSRIPIKYVYASINENHTLQIKSL